MEPNKTKPAQPREPFKLSDIIAQPEAFAFIERMALSDPRFGQFIEMLTAGGIPAVNIEIHRNALMQSHHEKRTANMQRSPEGVPRSDWFALAFVVDIAERYSDTPFAADVAMRGVKARLNALTLAKDLANLKDETAIDRRKLAEATKTLDAFREVERFFGHSGPYGQMGQMMRFSMGGFGPFRPW